MGTRPERDLDGAVLLLPRRRAHHGAAGVRGDCQHRLDRRSESSCLVAAYNVAKAGVISFTRTLSLELAAYGVKVNAISPDPVYIDFNKTVMAQRCKSLDISEDEMIERVRKAIPLGRWGQPEDIANQVVYLCGDGAGWITGKVLRVSGGLKGFLQFLANASVNKDRNYVAKQKDGYARTDSNCGYLRHWSDGIDGGCMLQASGLSGAALGQLKILRR